MDLLPTTLGTRPRLAVELRPEGVVAARAEDTQALLSAVAYGVFAEGALLPGLKAGNVVAHAEMVLAVRKALEAVAEKERQTTLVVPDAAVRVLLLDFDQLPAKAAEALPIVRFRLKKLLPFDADEAAVSYQVMSSSRGLVRVLAVAVPKDVLREYEAVIREAGFEPGAVMPSTLAACAGLPEIEIAALVVNAGETAVTTAIVQGGVLLLHRTVDLIAEGPGERGMVVAGVNESPGEPKVASDGRMPSDPRMLALVERESSAGEWARQEPLNGYGVVEDDRIGAEAGMQALRTEQELRAEYADATLSEQEERIGREAMLPPLPSVQKIDEQRLVAAAREVTQAVSVAAAYFEDTLQMAPGMVLAAGTLGAEALGTLLREAGYVQSEMRVREMVEPEMLTGGAVSSRVPRGWMAGVRGALRS